MFASQCVRPEWNLLFWKKKLTCIAHEVKSVFFKKKTQSKVLGKICLCYMAIKFYKISRNTFTQSEHVSTVLDIVQISTCATLHLFKMSHAFEFS